MSTPLQAQAAALETSAAAGKINWQAILRMLMLIIPMFLQEQPEDVTPQP